MLCWEVVSWVDLDKVIASVYCGDSHSISLQKGQIIFIIGEY